MLHAMSVFPSGLADNELVLVCHRVGIQFGKKATGKFIDVPAIDSDRGGSFPWKASRP